MSYRNEEFPITTIETALYFPQLQEIPHPCPTLFMRGSLDRMENTVYLAVVGSRTFTNYGKATCESLISGLAGYPITIVSGLALGIDAIAHQAALSAGLPTIAFPGSGLNWDVLYPVKNKTLAQSILEQGGALLSEFEHDQVGAPWTFPRRNRLEAGIAMMTLVIEAEEKSGTLITARLATEYNRTVGAVPGPIMNPTSRGANWLLKLGAVPITDTHDIVRELGLSEKEKVDFPPSLLLNSEEERIITYLSRPALKETIIEDLGLEPGLAGITFSTLEIKGLIKETLGLLERTI